MPQPIDHGDEGFGISVAVGATSRAAPGTGVANAKRIVSDPEILAVVGHYNSGVQIPSSEVYHASGLCNVSPANTNPKVTSRGYLEVNRIVGRMTYRRLYGPTSRPPRASRPHSLCTTRPHTARVSPSSSRRGLSRSWRCRRPA